MKNKFLSMFRMAALIVAACGMMVACTEENPEPDTPNPGQGSLILKVNPSTIVADGVEKAIFTVTDEDGEDETMEVRYICSTTNETLNGNSFSTTTAGTYEFYAVDDDNVKSNTVSVTATAVEEQTDYTLTVTPSTIIADGIGMATFTVKDKEEKDVTAEAVIYNVKEQANLKGNTFSTYNAGTYQFYAFVGESKTNTVTLEATMQEAPAVEDVPTPIRWQEMHAFPASPDDGCEIEVTGVQYDNFQFVVRPGSQVVTYRVDVYPLCRLYNALFNSLCGATDYTAKVEWALVEEDIRGYVFDTSGSGAYVFDSNGGEEREFDWMNSAYQQADLVPGAEYLIIAVGCYDKEGFDQGDISICHVTTKQKELIGNPEVKITVETGWKKARVTHSPANSDTKYFYNFMSTENDVMPFIQGYGRKMYRDFMRHTLGDPLDINDGSANWNMYNWGSEADPSVVWMASAIGLDANETPSEEFQTVLFQLDEVPDGIVEGTGTIKADEKYTSSTVVWYDYTIDYNARTLLHKILSSDLADQYKNDENALAALAIDIDSNGGWGLSNDNFGYNTETAEYTGESLTSRDFQILSSALEGNGGYTDGGSYQFAYVLRNAANDLSKVNFSEPFTSKARVLDAPETCQSNGVATLTSAGRTSIKFTAEYDFENTSGIHFNWFFGDPETLTREQALQLAIAGGEQPSTFWWAVPGGKDEFTIAGVDVNTTYTMVYVYEDWNGVFGEIGLATCTTEEPIGGDNPSAEILTEMTPDGLKVSFQANDDTLWMKYAVGDKSTEGTSLMLNYLGEDIGMGTPAENAQYFYDTWQLWVSGEAGMYTANTSASVFNALSSNELYVILCQPYGKNDVPGKLAYKIYDHGQIKNLSDYYTGATMSVKKMAKSAPQVGQPHKRNAIPAMLLRPEPIEWENAIDKMVGGEFHIVDMKSYTSHPKVR